MDQLKIQLKIIISKQENGPDKSSLKCLKIREKKSQATSPQYSQGPLRGYFISLYHLRTESRNKNFSWSLLGITTRYILFCTILQHMEISDTRTQFRLEPEER